MCGRVVTTSGYELATLVRAILDEEFAANYNGAPTQPIPMVGLREGERHLRRARWGLVPSWSKGVGSGPPMFNARSETLASNGAFRAAYAKRRCLVPLAGFYEWRKLEGGSKQPVFIHAAQSPLLLAAGLWEAWHPGEPDEVRSCTIITCEPNRFMASIHDRMPVLLDAEGARLWLESDTPREALQALLAPAHEALLAAHEVSSRVGSVKNNGPELMEPVRASRAA